MPICERKASAMAMSFVAKYPDRLEIIPELIDTAVEELEHFKLVYQLMEQRGVQLPAEMGQDMYVKQLIDHCHSGRKSGFWTGCCLPASLSAGAPSGLKWWQTILEDEPLKKFYKTYGLQRQAWQYLCKNGFKLF